MATFTEVVWATVLMVLIITISNILIKILCAALVLHARPISNRSPLLPDDGHDDMRT